MNILMLNYEFPPLGGGASPVSYDIGKKMAERGHKITVVTMGYKDLPDYEEKDGMEIHRVKCLRTQKMVCHPWEQATYIIAARNYLRHKLNVKEYDICYTHFIIPTGVVARWCKKKYGLDYVITSHGSDVIGHNNKRFKALYKLVKNPWRKIVRDAKAIVSPSEYLKELMKKTEPDGNYKVIQNGIDTNTYFKTEEKEKKILVMCRLQETKNVQTIIKAIEKVELKDWGVDILGDGPYRENLENLVKDLKLEDKVIFRGWIENKSNKHLEALRNASIFMSASRVENCPTSILEAISCGAWCILSDIPAHRQLVEAIDKNVFFNKDDYIQLADKLQNLIDKIDETGMYANNYNMKQFDWEKCIEQYESTF